MDSHSKGQRRSSFQQDLGPLQKDIHAIAREEWLEFLHDQITQRDSLPALSTQQGVGGTERVDSPQIVSRELLHGLGSMHRLRREGYHDSQHVLDAMIELINQ